MLVVGGHAGIDITTGRVLGSGGDGRAETQQVMASVWVRAQCVGRHVPARLDTRPPLAISPRKAGWKPRTSKAAGSIHRCLGRDRLPRGLDGRCVDGPRDLALLDSWAMASWLASSPSGSRPLSRDGGSWGTRSLEVEAASHRTSSPLKARCVCVPLWGTSYGGRDSASEGEMANGGEARIPSSSGPWTRCPQQHCHYATKACGPRHDE